MANRRATSALASVLTAKSDQCIAHLPDWRKTLTQKLRDWLQISQLSQAVRNTFYWAPNSGCLSWHHPTKPVVRLTVTLVRTVKTKLGSLLQDAAFFLLLWLLQVCVVINNSVTAEALRRLKGQCPNSAARMVRFCKSSLVIMFWSYILINSEIYWKL